LKIPPQRKKNQRKVQSQNKVQVQDQNQVKKVEAKRSVSSGDLQSIFEKLLEEERIEEAIQCKAFSSYCVELDEKKNEYDKAKNEDRLHDAIEIRNAMTKIQQSLEMLEIEAPKWQKPNEKHQTVNQLQGELLEKLGTKQALPVLEEFVEVSIPTIAKTDLKRALAVQKTIRKKIKDAMQQTEEEKKKNYTDEELRWLKEAEERKKKKKELKKQIGGEMKSVMSNPNRSSRSNKQGP